MFDITRKFTVQIDGGGKLVLGPNDHVATGGEGHVFRKGRIAIKIWGDSTRAAQGRMPERIRILSAMRDPMVVAPEALVRDTAGREIGFTMPWIENSWAVPMAFTNDWRVTNGFGDAEALAFSSRMRQATASIHAMGVTIGDANELNVLGKDREPRFIDVDSWIPAGFTGDKIMPTVRDWHTAPFSREADWFAWGVVTYQLLTGIHPYRGTHPNFKRADMEGRMKANASVFDPGVRLPAAVRDSSRIPGPLLDWYVATFRDGVRTVPPDPAVLHTPSAAPRRATGIRSAVGFLVVEAWSLPSPLLRMVAPDILMLEGGLLVSLADGRAYGKVDTRAALTRAADGAIHGIIAEGGMLRFGMLRAAPGISMSMTETGIAASGIWASENRIFAVVADGILEIEVRDLGARHAALPGRKWALNPNATTFGDGVALYDALGAAHLVAPLADGGVSIVRTRELDGLKPIAMVRRGRVAVLSLMDRSGHYKRAVGLLDEAGARWTFQVADADDGNLTDVVTPTGVVVRFDADGKLDLQVPTSGARRSGDAGEAAGGRLLAGPSGTHCAVGGKVFRVTVA